MTVEQEVNRIVKFVTVTISIMSPAAAAEVRVTVLFPDVV